MSESLLSDESLHGFIMKMITVQGFCSLASMYLHNPMYPRLYTCKPSECLSFSLLDTVNILWSTTFIASEVILDWGGASCWLNMPQGSFHFNFIFMNWHIKATLCNFLEQAGWLLSLSASIINDLSPESISKFRFNRSITLLFHLPRWADQSPSYGYYWY